MVESYGKRSTTHLAIFIRTGQVIGRIMKSIGSSLSNKENSTDYLIAIFSFPAIRTITCVVVNTEMAWCTIITWITCTVVNDLIFTKLSSPSTWTQTGVAHMTILACCTVLTSVIYTGGLFWKFILDLEFLDLMTVTLYNHRYFVSNSVLSNHQDNHMCSR